MHQKPSGKVACIIARHIGKLEYRMQVDSNICKRHFDQITKVSSESFFEVMIEMLKNVKEEISEITMRL